MIFLHRSASASLALAESPPPDPATLVSTSDIDFGFAEARTTYGVIGCKVWVYKGDHLRERARRATA